MVKEKHAKVQFGGAVNKVRTVLQVGKVGFVDGSDSTELPLNSK